MTPARRIVRPCASPRRPRRRGMAGGRCRARRSAGPPQRRSRLRRARRRAPLGAALADLLGGAFFPFSEAFSASRVACSAVMPTSRRYAGATSTAIWPPATSPSMPWRYRPAGDIRRHRDRPARRRAPTCARRPCALRARRRWKMTRVRVLRLVRLQHASRLRARRRSSTVAAARAAAGPEAVSGERVEREFTALLGLPAPRAGAAAARRPWALSIRVLPELDRLRGVEQNPFHHLDVFGHTLEALELPPSGVEQLGGQRYLTAPASWACRAPRRWRRWPTRRCCTISASRRIKAVDEDGRVMFCATTSWARDGARHRRRLKMSRRFQDFLAAARAPASAPRLPGARGSAHAARSGALPTRRGALRLRVGRPLAGRPHGDRGEKTPPRPWPATSAWRATYGCDTPSSRGPPLTATR